MNIDHTYISVFRVLRLALVTALFAIVCGLPDSLGIVLAGIRTLMAAS